jgi:hypothetical protein
MPSAVRRGHSDGCTRTGSAKSVIQWYGWDAPSRIWHGPSQLGPAAGRSQRLEDALLASSGPSWFGPVICSVPGEPAARFFVVAHDLPDCAVAMLYCDESKAGPAEIVAVIPAERRSRLRPEFAFEFLAFTGFLRSLGDGVECEVSEAIAAALAEAPVSDSLVFSITTGLWACDMDYVLSRCVEQTAMAVLRWLGRFSHSSRA